MVQMVWRSQIMASQVDTHAHVHVHVHAHDHVYLLADPRSSMVMNSPIAEKAASKFPGEAPLQHDLRAWLEEFVSFVSHTNAATLWAWTDSDWSVMWSTTGVVLMLAGAAILCVSRRQHCITLSTTEAELMAMSAGSVDIVYMRTLLGDLGLPQQNIAEALKPTPLRCDNKGAVPKISLTTVPPRRALVTSTVAGSSFVSFNIILSSRSLQCPRPIIFRI